MKYLRILCLALVGAAVLVAIGGASSASATAFWKYTTNTGTPNDTLGTPLSVTISLTPGTSTLHKDTGGLANDTCTGSEIEVISESTVPVPRGKISSLTFTGCSHTTTVLANGEMEFLNVAGTTNGTVIVKGTRVTVKSTVFGISCVASTGAGTTVGSLTGAKSDTEHATLTINGVITLENGCGDSTWSGHYTVTEPTGLMIEAET
jgi:hypothetical protein